jgi:SAM-dependent methyltransferase
MRSWLNERYLPCEQWLERLSHESDLPLVLDAGCGGGLSGFEYWKPALDQIEYFGIDVSNSVDVAKRRFDKTSVNTKGFFMQEDIANLPFTERMFDVVFSEGVLHHTDNTEKTFAHLAKLLKPGGLFMFYIYRKKGPIREYTDDYIRDKLQSLSPEQGWQALEGLTHLGIELGKLDIEIDVPEDIDLIDIPKGKINLQRLFYWHVFKAFYDPNLTFDEMHHINFDWYAPKNARRHTAEEVNSWCTDCDLKIERLIEEPAGITCIAQKV